MSVRRQNKKWKEFNFDSQISEQTDSTSKSDKCLKDQESVDFNFEDKLTPKVVHDLAVHCKKIKEVESWLHSNVISSKYKCNASMLLLTGPTGSGKTITVQVLCREMNIEISEWVNPIEQDFEIYHGPSQRTRLLEFLSESKYPSLFSVDKPKIMLIKDYPNFLIHNPSNFTSILEKCFCNKTAIVFVCTDASNNKLNLSQTLFPPELREQYSMTNISFNPCSVTLLKEALRRAHVLVQQNLDIFQTPSQSVIESIISSAMGDIRCAVNQYYFACLKGSKNLPTIETETRTGTKRKRNDKVQSKVKNMIKDESLGLFHSLGRILNPKLQKVNGSYKLQCDLESLIEEVSTQPTSFVAFLHENYFKYFGDINDVSKAAEILSLSEAMFGTWTERYDTLILALWITVLGLMIHNKHRVSKWNQIRGPVKVRKFVDEDSKLINLPVSDLCFYNIITKTNKYHKFS